MKKPTTVLCDVKGYLRQVDPYQISFNMGEHLELQPFGELGPYGISEEAADLADFAIAIYMIEKQMKGNKRTNPPDSIRLHMKVRNPTLWTDKTISILQDIFLLLGNAKWEIEISGGLNSPKPDCMLTNEKKIERVVLFSGGMDSSCGLMTLNSLEEKTSSALVSFYTKQKSLQKNISQDLGFDTHVQWGKIWNLPTGRGKSFYYRSFLFLCLAAVVAESWNIKDIIQFENGILASAIPPSPAWRMTKHAHPILHQMMAKLLSEFFGGEWSINNPFLLRTKRECFLDAIKTIGEKEAVKIIKRTETCWFQYSNRAIGGRKTPGVPCGACIPCIVRRTAFSYDRFKWDLCKDANKNNDKIGINFRSFYGFLDQIQNTKSSPLEFYRLLPSVGRQLLGTNPLLNLENLQSLYYRFSNEFMDTFQPQK